MCSCPVAPATRRQTPGFIFISALLSVTWSLTAFSLEFDVVWNIFLHEGAQVGGSCGSDLLVICAKL